MHACSTQGSSNPSRALAAVIRRVHHGSNHRVEFSQLIQARYSVEAMVEAYERLDVPSLLLQKEEVLAG